MIRIDPKPAAQPTVKLGKVLARQVEQATRSVDPKRASKDEMSTGAGRALRLEKLGGRPLGTQLHDLLVATKLKGAVASVLATVKLGKPLAEKDEPRPGVGGRYTAPNGDPLIRVKLSGDELVVGRSEYALVNPKTNEFYKERNAGGITHPTNYYGPLSLPKNVQFQGKKFSPAELKRLEQTANKTLLPIRRGLEATLDAHLKAGDLNFNNTAPRPEDVLSSRVIKSEHPFTYTAIVLKDDPTHVIIKKVLTGGFVPAGPNAGSYSQPISIQ